MGRKRRRSIHTRIVVFIAVLAALAGGGVFLAQKLTAPTFLVGKIAEAVKKATGRTLRVGARPSVKLFPRIAVVLHDVRLSNPPGMGKDDFAKVAKLEVEVEFWPLLQRELVIRKLYLEQPEIHLLVDERGRNNWTFDTADAAPAAKSAKNAKSVPADGGDKGGDGGTRAGTANAAKGKADAGAGLIRDIRLAPLVLRDGVVLFDDARSGTRQLLRDLDMTVKLSSPGSPLDMRGNVIWRQQRVGFALFVKDPARLSGRGSPVEAFLKAPGARVEYTGLAGLGKGPKLAGTVSASGESLRGLLHWLGVGLPARGPGLGAFSLSGAVEATGPVLTLKKLKMRLDGSNAQGSARLDMSGKVTAITVALGVDRLVTDTYLGAGPTAAPAGARGKAAKAAGQKDRRAAPGTAPASSPSAAGAGGWSAAPIVPDLPANVRADVRVSVNTLRHRRLKMGPGAVRFVLRDGRFSATLDKMAFYGGAMAGKLALRTAGKKPQTAATFRFNGVSARPFLTDLAGFDYLSGKLSGEVDVKTLGRSQLEMVGNLTGLANLNFRQGKVHGIDLVKLLELVQKGIVSGWQFDENATTDFVELVAKFMIVDGIAGVRQLSMKGPLVEVVGKGEVDLLRQRLDLSFNGGLVKRKAGKEASVLKIPVPLVVKGSWQSPKIYPDIAGILKDPKAALEQLQGLLRAMGGKKPAARLDKAREAVKRKIKANAGKVEGKVEKKVQRQLEKVLGDEQAAETAKKATRQMKKLLDSFFGKKPKAPRPAPEPTPAPAQ